MRALWLLLLVPLAGCLGGEPEPGGDARSAYEVSQSAVDDRYEYALFLGVTGTEGDLDWDAYEEDLRAQGGQAARLAEAFDQDVPDEAFGDGELGAWMTTHFAYDSDRRLVGGLFTQVLRDGSRNALLAPFTGPYAGTPTAVSMGHRLAMTESLSALDQALDAQENEPVLCTLLTNVDQWKVSSKQAAAIAQDTPEVQEHMARYPAGELTYFYFPQLAVEDDCPAELDAPSNHWTVFHTDLDAYLAGELPTVAKVVIDAANGTIRETSIGPLLIRAPSLLDETIHIQDPPVGLRQTHTYTATVEEGATLLEWHLYRTERPARVHNDGVALIDPEGRMLDARAFDVPLQRFLIENPIPGTWRMEYDYQPLVPLGQHTLELRGAVLYG